MLRYRIFFLPSRPRVQDVHFQQCLVVESVVAGKMTLCKCAGTNCTSSLVLLHCFCSHFVGTLFSLGLIIYKMPVASRHISSSKKKNINQCLLVMEPEVDK